MSTLNQKLRLGGKGATSMFRAIGWLPKLLTSGSYPSYGTSRNRFRAATVNRAYRAPRQSPPTTL